MLQLDSLNQEQRRAVLQTEGPVLILAGAGSGKTRVLCYRIAHLTQDLGVKPYHILAITFTNKAAGEMKERVERLCGLEAGEMWVMTFHACCLRILKRHAREIGMESGFIIYDPEDQKTIIRRILKELELSDRQFTPKGVLAEIGSAKDELMTTLEYAEKAAGNFYKEKVALVYERYQKTLSENHALDFDDLIFKTVVLFRKHPEILSLYQEKFRYIMVDEYQDTNTAQYRLISLLASRYGNLCVVGDDDQSIYRFRGANIRNILEYEKDFPGAFVIRLEQNYRSTANILNAANAVIRHNESRKSKTLWTEKPSGEPLTLIAVQNDKAEAETLIAEVQRLRERGRAYRDMAFLYRANSQSRALEEALVQQGIPYRLFGGTPFYQRKEIKDLLAYLRFIVNDSDYVSAERILGTPPRGIGEVTRQHLLDAARSHERGVVYSILSLSQSEDFARSAKKLTGFAEQVLEWRSKSVTLTISELCNVILQDIAYAEYLKKDDELKLADRLENLEEFRNRAEQYEEDADDPSLAGFLEEISLVTAIDTYDEEADVLSLMTLHSAKGLEFPIVFLPGFEDGVFPSYMSISSGDEEDIAEERRLCYVGITRAQEKLYLSYAKARRVNGQTEFHRPSRFLSEIPLELIEEREAEPSSRFSYRDESEDDSFGRPRAYRSLYEERRAEMLQPHENPYSFSRPQSSAVSKAPTDASQAFCPGDTVLHPTFGRGTVREAKWLNTDWMLSVEFEKAGMKKIMAKFANMKKL